MARAVTGRARMRGRETGERRDVARPWSRVPRRAPCGARLAMPPRTDGVRRRTACEARRAACDAGVSRGSRLAALGARRIVLESSNE
ncbi:hypothetical protein AQ876_07550 [Burkholderia pseudomallei]|nr:hypothetical protein AQ861_17545 [Burkholderia pseudomallei]ONA10260.1 hypothetical protein AQ876_07550 [Burkholderia pseudomallei]ONC46984.1 hypothetical protein AQ914_10665 [Burkholderia pseudomallei]